VITCSDLNLTSSSALFVDLNRTTGYRPSDSARFKCRRGYRLVGPQVIRCTWLEKTKENATWDSLPPLCDEILCRAPPSVEHARMTNTSSSDIAVPVDGHVTYECSAGYKMAARGNRLKCDERGEWQADRPHCEPITCRQPEVVANGSLTATIRPPLAIVVGTTVSYRCNAGFVGSGLMDIVCLDDGQWNGSAPRCLPVACPPPGETPHGTVSGREFTFGGRIRYSCDAGYVLDGNMDERTCGETGEWVPAKTPACTPRPCELPQPVIHGHIVSKNTDSSNATFEFGDYVEYECVTGYRLIGLGDRKCSENGTWSGHQPSCVKITCRSPTPSDHAVIVGGTPRPTTMPDHSSDSFDPGSIVRYRCASGYAIDGKDTRSCRSDGTWTGPLPRCIAVNCTVPAEIDHGWIVINEEHLQPTPSAGSTRVVTSFGSTVEYHCDEGYKLAGGPSVRTCTDGRRWTGSEPRCIVSDEPPVERCQDPEEIAHGTVEGNDFSVGSTIRIACDLGFRMIGDDSVTSLETVRTCLVNRTWSGPSPDCRPIRCDRPSEFITNGRVVGSNYSYDATIIYVCDDGFTTTDGPTSTRTCKLDGRWSGLVPLCERVKCPSPLVPPNAEISPNGSDYRFGDRVTYGCRPGYRLEGLETHECQADRTWRGNETRCVKVECPRPADPEHGQVVLDEGLFYGQPARYECNDGYSLEGPEIRRCDMNGQWSGGEQTRCTKIICGKPPKIDYGIPVVDQV